MEMWLLSKLPVFQAVNTWRPNFRTLTIAKCYHWY